MFAVASASSSVAVPSFDQRESLDYDSMHRSSSPTCSITSSETSETSVSEPHPSPRSTANNSTSTVTGTECVEELEIQTWVASQDRFTILSKLGTSIYGQVYLAFDKKNNCNVAVKVSHMKRMQEIYQANNVKAEVDVIESPLLEAKLMKQVSTFAADEHPNVLAIVDEFFSHDFKLHWLVMEYAPNSDLFEHVTARGACSEDEARHLLHQLAQGLHHIHSKNICHLDMSLENVLLDANNKLKICDFGVARKLPAEGARFPALHVRSKPSYMSPEVLHHLPFDGCKSDVFSLGVIFYCILLGHKPFEYADKSQISYCLIASGRVREYLRRCGSSVQLSEEAVDLLSGMLCPEYRRYSLTQVLAHPFFSNAAL